MATLLRLLLDVGPIALFFYANGVFGIYAATALFMVVAVTGLAITWMIERRIAIMPLISTLLVLVFGGLTLALADETFIKMKPTILYLLFAGVLFIGLMRRRYLLGHLFGAFLILPDEALRILTWRMIGLFCAQAVFNEYMWRNYSTDTWILSKLGMLAFGFIFFMAQTPLLMRHGRPLPDASDQ